MKIKGIELDDQELPSKITVEMTVREAALMIRFIGPTSGDERRKYQLDGGEVGSGIWDALSGGVFNRFWDDGIDGVPR